MTNLETSAISSAANSRKKVSGLTHDYYNYPARFSPVLAREIIKEFTNHRDLVLDPFVGGGTTLVEARILGRIGIGFDVSTLSFFLSQIKTNPIKPDRISNIKRCFSEIISELNIHRSTPRPVEWIEKGYQRNLEKPGLWQLRKLIEQYLFFLEVRNLGVQEENFLRCVILKTGQWALDTKKQVPSISSFKIKLSEHFARMIDGADEFWKISEDSIAPHVINSSATEIHRYKSLFSKAPKLVVTSPPYPGIHVVYHRWQIFGRRETPAPFWIANSLDGHGLTHYAMGNRQQKGLATYFNTILNSFKSIRSVCDKNTIVVQILAFSDIDWQLPKYLETMEESGFRELEFAKIWRDVPNRKWYAQQKGSTSSSKEVILFHTPDF